MISSGYLVDTILQRIGFADVDIDVVREHEGRLKQIEDRKNAAGNPLLFQSDQELDESLAKEDEHGRMVLVDNERQAVLAQQEREKDDKSKTASIHPGAHMAGDLQDQQRNQSLQYGWKTMISLSQF